MTGPDQCLDARRDPGHAGSLGGSEVHPSQPPPFWSRSGRRRLRRRRARRRPAPAAASGACAPRPPSGRPPRSPDPGAGGTAGAGGYRPVVSGPGEAHLVRTDLGALAAPGRAAGRTPVIAFAQLSDVHIVDAQSPLRLEFTDRLDDPSPLPPTLFSSAYRPQEMLSGQIADAMVREINAIGVGPVTGQPLALAIQTGDNSDNSQFNEVRWNIGILDGGQVRVDSGSLPKYEGVADDNAPTTTPRYWHPHGTPGGQGRRRLPRSVRLPGRARAAGRRPDAVRRPRA